MTTLVSELVFLDATLPGRDGITVARQLMAIHPAPIVLLGAELPADRLAAATLAGVMGVLGTRPSGGAGGAGAARRTTLL